VFFFFFFSDRKHLLFQVYFQVYLVDVIG